MKRILKIVPIFLLALVLAVSPLLMSVPVFASSQLLYIFNPTILPVIPVDLDDYPTCILRFYDGEYTLICCTSYPVVESAGVFSGDTDGVSLLYGYDMDAECWYFISEDSYSQGVFVFTCELSELVWSSVDLYYPDEDAHFYGSDPVLYSPASSGSDGEVVTADGIFYQAYDLFSTYIYGVEADALTSDQTLTLTVLATAAALFLVSLPFILVIGFIKLFR